MLPVLAPFAGAFHFQEVPVHSHTFTYGDICQIKNIWQREGGLSSERVAQFAEFSRDAKRHRLTHELDRRIK